MTEKLLHFIWQFVHFNRQELQTDEGEPLQIIKPGLYNSSNQGPDFLEASIKIADIIFVGNIEIHIKSSDWHQHHHTKDANYSNIILHIVWENDAAIKNSKGSIIPTLSLQNRVSKILLQRYEQLMQNNTSITCNTFLPALTDIGWIAWKERLAAERLETKAKRVLQLYEESNHHWEEVFWWMLAANFGIKVNSELFEQVARSISINILAKHKNQIHQVESLLLGQANLLNDDMQEDYPKLLQKEYLFLQKKHQLKKISIQPHFLRMRPANFPTIRLAQLAMLIYSSSHLFSTIKELKDVSAVKYLFDVTCNDYWHYHFVLNEETAYQPKHIGNQMIENIIINTIIPVLFAYGLYHKDEVYKEKAIDWLSNLSPENNTITRQWKELNIANKHALDSQSLIQLTNEYCKKKRCLSCTVGNKICRTE